MADSVSSAVSRREFLYAVAVAAAPVAFLAQVRASLAQSTGSVLLEPTPAVGDDDLAATPHETIGPAFKPNSPLKNNFRESGVTGALLTLSGFVLDKKGKPIKGALLDFWHADADGQYDFSGFRCRGHQFSEADGRYELQTIVPGIYPGRTRHCHIRLQASPGPILTTQLYFPDEPGNSSDFLFRRDLLLKIRDTDHGRLANFNFVLETAG
ncbi:MAG: twin-arginine translocation signal domain-containing protein [Verrucomicrobia bacterium]|nr:twin-arginine translocation signal domain-containing protein [Verrucomicrobiota bacterium]MBV8275233.1 twin-arginine translocation signal domain-containing protein [Verrucomicrobiota bacterium]